MTPDPETPSCLEEKSRWIAFFKYNRCNFGCGKSLTHYEMARFMKILLILPDGRIHRLRWGKGYRSRARHRHPDSRFPEYPGTACR